MAVCCNILDISCLNAYILHNAVFPSEEGTRRRRVLLELGFGFGLTAAKRVQPIPQLGAAYLLRIHLVAKSEVAAFIAQERKKSRRE